MIVIREFAIRDLDDMVELMRDLGYPVSRSRMRKRMEIIGSDPACATLIAELDGEVAGMAGLRLLYGYEFDGPVVQISALVTKAKHRGLGAGKALIRHAEQWARERGAVALVLASGNRPEREAAHRFYRRMGFDVTGLRFSKRL
jgi:GNAT superfamily N-acetyltransferase